MSTDFLHIDGATSFNEEALRLFRYQVMHCAPYRIFCQALGRTEAETVEEIPYLPIGAFKTHEVRSTSDAIALTFKSSGTTGMSRSTHHISTPSIYEQSFVSHFEACYGPAESLCILALLPSYLEQGESSLVYMADHLIKKSGDVDSGFFLHDLQTLEDRLRRLKDSPRQGLLIGVSYALLDLAERHPNVPKDLIVMETGGMKGRREELIREELHRRLSEGLGVSLIHSEYGMTELLSQAYSLGDGRFHCPPWMQVRARQTDDPLSPAPMGRTGGLNIIDLANQESCAFIATDDLGRVHADGSFEVLGRFDRSDVRGCNLMVV